MSICKFKQRKNTFFHSLNLYKNEHDYFERRENQCFIIRNIFKKYKLCYVLRKKYSEEISGKIQTYHVKGQCGFR